MSAAARHPCPYCCGTGYSQEDAENAAVAAGLREACRASGAPIMGDDRVSETTAAMLVGREPGTLRNWRSLHRPIPFIKRRGRVSYAISDIARWMKSASIEPEA